MNTSEVQGAPVYPDAKYPEPAEPVTHAPLPVSGYKAQTQETVEVVNSFKRDEERLLRKLDEMKKGIGLNTFDQRWLNIGRTHLEQAFMTINRAVFRPDRVRLPGDPE